MNLDSLPCIGEPVVNGTVALGVTHDGQISSGTWIQILVKDGRATMLIEDTHPPRLAPSIERLDELSDKHAERVILIAAALQSTWMSVPSSGIVEAMDRGLIALDGDEGIFIRYLDDCLLFMESACRLLP